MTSLEPTVSNHSKIENIICTTLPKDIEYLPSNEPQTLPVNLVKDLETDKNLVRNPYDNATGYDSDFETYKSILVNKSKKTFGNAETESSERFGRVSKPSEDEVECVVTDSSERFARVSKPSADDVESPQSDFAGRFGRVSKPSKEMDVYRMEVIDSMPYVAESPPQVQISSSEKISISYLEENFPPAPEYGKFYSAEEAIELCQKVVMSGKPNFAETQIEIKSGYNIPLFSFLLQGYDKEKLLINGIKYGWQLNWTCFPLLCGKVIQNHPSVEKEYPIQSKRWFEEQVEKGMLVGPIDRKKIPW